MPTGGKNDILGSGTSKTIPYPPEHICIANIYIWEYPTPGNNLPPPDNTAYVAQVTEKRVFLTHLAALSLQSYDYTNAAGSFGVPKCGSDNMVKKTCNEISDRCMTMNYNCTFLIFQSTETKNCFSSLACDAQFNFSCKCTRPNHFLQDVFSLCMNIPFAFQPCIATIILSPFPLM